MRPANVSTYRQQLVLRTYDGFEFNDLSLFIIEMYVCIDVRRAASQARDDAPRPLMVPGTAVCVCIDCRRAVSWAVREVRRPSIVAVMLMCTSSPCRVPVRVARASSATALHRFHDRQAICHEHQCIYGSPSGERPAVNGMLSVLCSYSRSDH